MPKVVNTEWSYESELTFTVDHRLTQQQRERLEECIYNKLNELLNTSSFDTTFDWKEYTT